MMRYIAALLLLLLSLLVSGHADSGEESVYSDGSKWLEEGEKEMHIKAKIGRTADGSWEMDYTDQTKEFVDVLLDQRVRKLMAEHCGNTAKELNQMSLQFATEREKKARSNAYEIFGRLFLEIKEDNETMEIIKSCQPTLHPSIMEEQRGFWIMVCMSNTPPYKGNAKYVSMMKSLHAVMGCAQEMPLVAKAQLEAEYMRDGALKMFEAGHMTKTQLRELMDEPHMNIPTRESLKERFEKEEAERKERLAPEGPAAQQGSSKDEL